MIKNGKNVGGRPTKYKPEYCEQIVRYFSRRPTRRVEIKHYDKTGAYKWSDWRLEARPLPTFLEFSMKIGVDDDTLVEWSKEENKAKYPGFSAAYARAKELQKRFLIENGLNGSFNPQFAIFVAKNITDMKDKQEMDHNPDGKPIQISVVSYEPKNG